MKLATLALTLALSVPSLTANAGDMNNMQDMQQMHDMKGMNDMMGGSQSESSKAFNDAMSKMHEKMSMHMTGDADVDFVKGMIPHHQGAVEMAKIELQYGKDPELHKLAEGIVKAQESEIAFMKSWLEKHEK
ncbi:DUF305 domain-containing protein [Hyphomicrobium sp. 99]|uniref:CopM family metallochaperone n=1 Tax=Hyphomicrobium sp. 99 TaxID=1163419 RepID=UPI0005F794BC|nr:DUF305 domain-containing protein [Hyphomicrobium sp. 99]